MPCTLGSGIQIIFCPRSSASLPPSTAFCIAIQHVCTIRILRPVAFQSLHLEQYLGFRAFIDVADFTCRIVPGVCPGMVQIVTRAPQNSRELIGLQVGRPKLPPSTSSWWVFHNLT